jgi:hypothetical protein
MADSSANNNIDAALAADDEIPEKNGILSAVFTSCSPDPRGSVHRAWGISLLFVVLYFVLSIFERKLR